jgi:amidohydrolase
MFNDHGVAGLIGQVATELFGSDVLLAEEVGMGAEDFSYMTAIAPGAMFQLGVQLDERNRPHHSPVFDLDEHALPVGAAVLAETTLRLLRQYGGG